MAFEIMDYSDADKKYERVVNKAFAADRSMLVLKNHHKHSKSTYNRVWNVAHKARLLQKAVKTEGTGSSKIKKPSTRLNKNTGKHEVVAEPYMRRIGKAPIKTVVSAVASCEMATNADLAKQLRVHFRGKYSGSAALPNCARGTETLGDQIESEYAQSVFALAMQIKNAFKESKNVTARDIHLAAQLINERIAQATSIAPAQVVVLPSARKAKKAAEAAGEAGEEAEEKEEEEATPEESVAV